jgi:outer membrane protein assembly factor BamA
VLPADKLRELVHQQLGQPANAIQLARDTDAMQKLYGTHGYMAATIKLTPSMDDASSTVKYQIQVNEGDQYHMGDLDIQDLDRRDSSRAAAKWTLAKGDPYDSSYPKRFVDAVLKDVLTTGEWNISIHELPDPADKSVDVSVKFEHKASEL